MCASSGLPLAISSWVPKVYWPICDIRVSLRPLPFYTICGKPVGKVSRILVTLTSGSDSHFERSKVNLKANKPDGNPNCNDIDYYVRKNEGKIIWLSAECTLNCLFLANLLFDGIISAKTFELLPENTWIRSRAYNNRIQKPEKTCIFSDQPTSAGPVLNQKVNWSRISDQVLKEKYHGPLSVELATFDPFYHNDIEKASQVTHNFTE